MSIYVLQRRKYLISKLGSFQTFNLTVALKAESRKNSSILGEIFD